MSLMSTSSATFPRVSGFIGCDNGKGIKYGSLVPDDKVPDNFRTAVLELRQFFQRFGDIKVDVTHDDEGNPVINIHGEPGRKFEEEFNMRYRLEDGTHWKAIHKIIDPHDARLTPNLMYVWGSFNGFLDGSML